MTVVSTTSKRKHRRLKIFGGLYIGGIVAACVVLIYYWDIISRFQTYGYFGLFIMGLVTGFSLPMPVPYMVIAFILGGVMHPAMVGASCGLGLGIGGTLLHLTGRGGRKFFPMSSVFGLVNTRGSSGEEPPSFISRLFRRMRVPHMITLARRRGALIIFLISAAPNPFFAPVAIGLGTLRFRLWKFFVACWAGQTVKCVGIAYCGYLGLGTILRWLEVI
jgi:membrane protein YqaA with SNARE-associated domain